MDGHVNRENLELGIQSCRNGGHQSTRSALPIASVIASVPFDHCSLLFVLEVVDITVIMRPGNRVYAMVAKASSAEYFSTGRAQIYALLAIS